jgi:hypothetical protein
MRVAGGCGQWQASVSLPTWWCRTPAASRRCDLGVFQAIHAKNRWCDPWKQNCSALLIGSPSRPQFARANQSQLNGAALGLRSSSISRWIPPPSRPLWATVPSKTDLKT